MKKLMAVALVCVLVMTGCSKSMHDVIGNEVNVLEDDIIQNEHRTESNASTSNIKPNSEIPGKTTFIVDIWDRAEEEQLDCADAIEKFYEDEAAVYYFGCIKSHTIMVLDNTGRTTDVVTALNEGLATIADLDDYGIKYFSEPKLEIVEPYVSIPEFSYEEESRKYIQGAPGVKTSGFVNTSEAEINGIRDVDERAKNECTIEWDTIGTYLDTAECIWKTVFYTEGTTGNSQTVYLDYDGKTVLIVYGE